MKPGVAELAIILIIVVLLFGVGRISKIAGEFARGLSELRAAIREDDDGTRDL